MWSQLQVESGSIAACNLISNFFVSLLRLLHLLRALLDASCNVQQRATSNVQLVMSPNTQLLRAARWLRCVYQTETHCLLVDLLLQQRLLSKI